MIFIWPLDFEKEIGAEMGQKKVNTPQIKCETLLFLNKAAFGQILPDGSS